MQLSIPWSSSVFVFVIESTTIIHSLKCTVPFSLIVPLLSLAVTHCYLLSLVVLLLVTLCHLLHHSLSFVVTRCTTRCHSLSLDVPLVCLFINDPPRQVLFFHYLCGITLNKNFIKLNDFYCDRLFDSENILYSRNK